MIALARMLIENILMQLQININLNAILTLLKYLLKAIAAVIRLYHIDLICDLNHPDLSN